MLSLFRKQGNLTCQIQPNLSFIPIDCYAGFNLASSFSFDEYKGTIVTWEEMPVQHFWKVHSCLWLCIHRDDGSRTCKDWNILAGPKDREIASAFILPVMEEIIPNAVWEPNTHRSTMKDRIQCFGNRCHHEFTAKEILIFRFISLFFIWIVVIKGLNQRQPFFVRCHIHGVEIRQ